LKSAFDIGNAISQRVKEGKQFPNEIADQLLHLQQLILESQRALNDAAEEIRELKEQLAASQRAVETNKDLEWVSDGGFWILKSDREKGSNIPYCPACWGETSKLIPLNPGNGHGYYTCSIHKLQHSTEAARRWIRQVNTPPPETSPWDR
jgi:hypothetical protein